jgi:glycosyltransferase involved in cell wall biosynthesis
MQFSIIIPTLDNLEYLKLAIKSLTKNSTYNHEIIVHVNGKDKRTLDYLGQTKIKYTQTEINVGLCSGVNIATKVISKDYVVYAHDDMYFLPNWDEELKKNIEEIGHNRFYLSCSHISSHVPNKSKINHIYYDCGDKVENFKEEKLLENYQSLEFYDLQGSHWAPHIIHKDLWLKVGGFSEEFNPGFGSDPDLNMKLWKEGVRIFKGVDKSRVYHFGSLTTRKNKSIVRNDANKTFLLKWKISINYFVKYYLKRGDVYKEPLNNFTFSLSNFFELILCKIKYIYLKVRK